MIQEIHIAPEGTLILNGKHREKWTPDEITVEVRHPNYLLTDLNDWLRDRNKLADCEIIPIQVLVQAYHAMVLANEEVE